MAYLLKIDNIDDHLAHVLMERGATYTEIDLDYAFISETSITGEWSHLYRPTEGRINEKNAIVNFEYEEILKGIKKNYKDYIGHIIPDRILIIEDTEWEQKETSSDNSSWKITIAKVPKMLQEITGWDYIIKTRKFWTQHMDNAQKAAMIFAELIRIDKEDGSITKFTTQSYSRLTSTFGANWLDKDVKLPDISKERIEFVGMKRANGQITIGELEGESKEFEVGEVSDETPEVPFGEEPNERDEMQESIEE